MPAPNGPSELDAALADARIVRDSLHRQRAALLARCDEADATAREGVERHAAAIIHGHLSTSTIRLLLAETTPTPDDPTLDA